MKPRYPLMAGLAFGLAFLNAQAAPLRVLFFSKSSGWEHSVIKEDNGRLGYAQNVLSKIGPKNDIEFTFSKDGSLFTPDYLAQFDAVVFFTSGDLTSTGTDRYPGITGTGLDALFNYVAGGKGLIGLHSTSDTFHTNERGGGNNPIRLPRYRNYGECADRFIKMLGGEFIRHGSQQVAKATVVDSKFPGLEGVTEFNVQEEWYTLKEFAPDDHVLLVMQTGTMHDPDYKRAPYPLAWVRNQGKGRVGYNAMGHREDVWDSAPYQTMILGMIKWAAGAVTAPDLTPNLKEVTPDAMTLQPVPADVK